MEIVIRNELKNTILNKQSIDFNECLDFKFKTLLEAFHYFKQHDLYCQDEDGEDYPQQWQLEMLTDEIDQQLPKTIPHRQQWILTDDEIIDLWVLYLELSDAGLK